MLSRQGLQAIGMPLSFAFQQSMQLPSPSTTIIKPTLKSTKTPTQASLSLKTSSKSSTNRTVTVPKTVNTRVEPSNDFTEISRLANAGRIAEAINICQQRLKQQKTSVDLFYWLGLLHDSQGQNTQAAEYYRKALYLDPQHQETLAHLAMLLAAQGDIAGAKRLQARISKGGKHG